MRKGKKYPRIFWRPFFDIGACYFFVGVAMYLGSLSFYFYPISFLIVANRILALSLLCHEALHGSLFSNSALNDFAGRWLCAFPTFISFSRYRKLHLLHHRALAKKTFDPDHHLYKDYPLPPVQYALKSIRDVVTLRTLWKFTEYYTEFPDIFLSGGSIWERLKKNRLNGDFLEFFAFHLVAQAILLYFGWYASYILFFAIPLICITQPYVLLMGGLQHGPVPERADVPQLLSRSIRGPKLLMEILLPLNINYHAEHHLDASVPHYWLKDFSAELESAGTAVWASTYSDAIKRLFGRRDQTQEAQALWKLSSIN